MNASPPRNFPPNFPRFLSGGPETLRLSRNAAIGLVLYGLVLSAVMDLILRDRGAFHGVSQNILATLCTATIAARWLGRRLAVTAALFQLTSFYAFGWPVVLEFRGAVSATLFTAAMGAFAWANVPGRLPRNTQWRPSLLFFACGAGLLGLFFGWGEIAGIFLACFAYLLMNQDGRAFRFLAHPLGLVLWAIAFGVAGWRWPSGVCVADVKCLVKCLAGWHAPAAAAGGMLPWTLLAIIAVVVGFRQGHYATPFWQFVGCWLIVPILLATFGILQGHSVMAIAASPISMLAAVGLEALFNWRHSE